MGIWVLYSLFTMPDFYIENNLLRTTPDDTQSALKTSRMHLSPLLSYIYSYTPKVVQYHQEILMFLRMHKIKRNHNHQHSALNPQKIPDKIKKSIMILSYKNGSKVKAIY